MTQPERPEARLQRIRRHLAGLFPGRARDADRLTASAIATMVPDAPPEVMAMMSPAGSVCADAPAIPADVDGCRCGGTATVTDGDRVRAAVVDGDTPDAARVSALDDFLAGCADCAA